MTSINRSRALLQGLIAASLLALGAAGPSNPEAAGLPERHFLWRIERGGGTGYLMGSIHVLSKTYYPLSPVIEEAFGRSGTLVEEVDLGEMSSLETQMLIASKAMYSDGRTLDKVVSTNTYTMIESRFKNAGLPLEAFMQMKPWVVAAFLLTTELQRAGFDPDLGLDRHFYDAATAAGKQVEGLESVAFQIDRFDQMTDAMQEALVRETLRDLDVQRTNVKALADAWAGGDTATLERLLLTGLTGSPQVYERLLLERNRMWMPRIEACLARSRPCFIVVGAGHLVGRDGLIDLLARRGYRLTQQ